MHNGRTAFIVIVSIALALLIGCMNDSGAKEVIVESYTDYTPNPDDLALIRTIRANRDSAQSLQELYQGLPDYIYPSFAGFPIYEEAGVTYVKERLEQGYLNIGEIAAASTYSPVVSVLEWKSEHPNDGYLPQIYELAAEYLTPILLHIDPTNGMPILYLEEALEQHRDTSTIFSYANAYNPPSNIEALLAKHPNLYIDFFAGFTAYSRDSTNVLQDFVPVIEQYPDRFMLSTDSGYGLSRHEAAQGLYETSTY
jgi:hypothetical protein